MYNSQNIAQRIKIIAKEKGIPVKKMLMDIELGENTLQNMKTSVPKADNLAKIADYLDCSVDYLLERTDIKRLPTKKDLPTKNLFITDYPSKDLPIKDTPIKVKAKCIFKFDDKDDEKLEELLISKKLEKEITLLIHKLSNEDKRKLIIHLRKIKEKELLNV